MASIMKPDAPPLPEMREFSDAPAVRTAIYDNVLKAAQAIKPVSNTRYSLELGQLHYAGDDDFSLPKQKEAVLKGQSLLRRLRGTWTLKDTAGNTVDQKLATVAQVPHLTKLGTFILNGNEYSLAHQMRLQPGVFARIKDSGEGEIHLNVAPGKGLSHRYNLDPETGIFRLNISQSNQPLLPVLKAMGATDKDLSSAWGPELLAANLAKDDPRVIDKLYARLVRKPDPQASRQDKSNAIAAAFGAMEFDPNVTHRTLGFPHTHLTKEAALAATKKLLQVAKGEVEPDDRDHLAFQNFMGPEDLIAERMRRSGQVLNQALWKATYRGNLGGLPPGILTKHVHSAIMDSGLGMPLEEVNPTDNLDQQTRVSRLGYGGIPSVDSIPEAARAVSPSQLGYVDLVRAPESQKVGVDSRVSYAARKGNDGRIYSPFLNKQGQTVYKSPQDIVGSTIAFPGELEKGKPLVAALVAGKTRMVPRDQVDWLLPHFEHAFSPLSNMIPLKSSIKGQRVAMGSRFLTQALPLINAESPHVQAGMPNQPGVSFEDHYGKHMGAIHAKNSPGRVTKVGDGFVEVKYADGTQEKHELFQEQPNNRKTSLNNTPVVKAGDPIQPGQLLAKSNYTDDKGTVALGVNARVAYMPFRGLNFEDAYVVSDAMAKRMSSEHLYQHKHEWHPDAKKGKNAFISVFPATYGRKLLDNMDSEGIVKPGTRIHYGDPLILTAEPREVSHKQVHSSHKGSFVDNSVTWEHHADGVVTDVAKTPKGVNVAVKSVFPTQVGDKMSCRMGSKGVISAIIPNTEMPHDAQGKPYEVLANPMGVVTRLNPGQMAEASLGKIAELTGKKYKVEDFASIKDVTKYAQDELKKHGLKDMEEVTDPVSGRKNQIFTGNRFYMKLLHTSAAKGQGRGLGSYTSEDTPARGGDEGSKRVALMNTSALLSSGATQVLADAKMIRGQKNPEYWSAFMSGFTPPTPKVPLVYEKFINQLKGAGINVVRTGSQLHLMAMTDKDTERLAGDREIQNSDTVDWKNGMKERLGGLFDKAMTGGHGGNRWSAVLLHEPMPTPVFEDPIRKVLGLTQAQFESVMAGKESLNNKVGPGAIHDALKKINLDSAIAQCRQDIASGKRTARDNAIKKLGFLVGAKKQGIHPSDWVVSRVPVLPPIFRPVSVMKGSNNQLIADANYLYKEVIDANKALKDLSGKVDDVGQERLNLYKAFKGVTGLGDPIQPKHQEKDVKGLLRQVFGSSPKYGVVQRKLLGTPVDLVGRAVIVPSPELSMDEVGIPEGRAWSVYRPFVVRRLVRSGVGRTQALKYAEDRHPLARKALLEEMDDRPVVIDRAPVLHKFGMFAFRPRLTKGDVLQISPLIVAPMGADFDGDAAGYHVVASEAAKKEAWEKMLPSRNLLSVANLKQAVYSPRQEYAGALHAATSTVDVYKKPVVFASVKDATNAYKRGELSHDQRVEIM